MARRGLSIPYTPGQITAAARGDYGLAGAGGFLALYGGVVALDIFRAGGLEHVDRGRFAAYFYGGFAFALLAWYQPGFATIIVLGVMLIQLLNVLPAVMEWFGANVVGQLGTAVGAGRAGAGPRVIPAPPAPTGAYPV
jgi:hypothetical protein